MTPSAITAKGRAETTARPTVLRRRMQLENSELYSECLKSRSYLRIPQQVSELLRLVLRRIDQVAARHVLLPTNALSSGTVRADPRPCRPCPRGPVPC